MEAMNEIAEYLSPVSDSGDRDRNDEKSSNSTMDVEINTSDEEEDDFIGPKYEKQEPRGGIIHATRNVVEKMTASTINIERFRFIPLRLTEDERCLLNVLENALEVCEYTDVVDVTFSHTRKSKVSRIFESLVDVLSISCGLMVRAVVTKFLLLLTFFLIDFIRCRIILVKESIC